MLHADNPNPNWFERARRRLAPYVDKRNMDPANWIPLVCVALGYKTQAGKWGGFVLFGDSDKDGSLYHNAMFFFRLAWPWIGLGIRWRGTGQGREYFQFGIGWKRNGQLGLNIRVQSDDSAAEGTTGPNFGQAFGWAEGHK